MLHRRQEIETTIEKLAFGGQGVARYENLIVFVDDAIPGDRMRVRLRKVKKNHALAYPVELLEPSRLRIEAPCSHFGFCGGCKWQNLEYQTQLKFKKQHVVESLEHIGDIQADSVEDVIPSPLIFGYRNKMEFSFSENRWLPPEELANPAIDKHQFSVGFHVPRFFDRIIDIEKCWLQDERLNLILQFAKAYFKEAGIPVYHNRNHEGILRYLVLRRSFTFDQIMVNVVTFEPIEEGLREFADKLVAEIPSVTSVINNVNPRFAQVAAGDKEFLIYGDPVIEEKLGNYTFEISANSFFQTNSLQAENLYRVVADLAGGEGKTIWDLYSGTGSIAIFISSIAARITGFEISDSSVEDARRNAELNGVTNCEFVAGDIRFSMEERSQTKPDIIVCDPPRSGMHPDAVKKLLEISPPKIVYVSCNPTTLARDLSVLKEHYRLGKVQPVDMFPHTYHIETVCQLEKK
jgi:23S rRNA (uracil1939-C5)-methyltransferase